MACPSFQTTSFNCYLHCSSFKRSGSEKGFTCYIQCTHTQEKQDTQKYLLHKSQQDNVQLKITNHNRMHRIGLVSPLDFTRVYLPLSELLLHKEQNCCSVSRQMWCLVSGQRPYASEERSDQGQKW